MLQSFNVKSFDVEGLFLQYKRNVNPSMLKGFAFNAKKASNIKG
jgi:hypothetical protein